MRGIKLVELDRVLLLSIIAGETAGPGTSFANNEELLFILAKF